MKKDTLKKNKRKVVDLRQPFALTAWQHFGFFFYLLDCVSMKICFSQGLY